MHHGYSLARLVLFVVATALVATPQLTAADAPLKVFVLVGQSNMQGHAKVSTFDYLGDDPATRPLLEQMRGADGKPRTVPNTWISYLTQGKGPEDGEGVGPLTVGYGARTHPAKPSDKIGPEFTFGITVQSALRQPVLIIKTAWGGKSLHTDFRPPSAGVHALSHAEKASLERQGKDVSAEVRKRNQQSGEYYRRMVKHIDHVLSDIKRVYPDYDASLGYELAGFVWFQGWNDVVASSVYPQRGQPGGYDKYTEWMAQFIRDVRKELKAPHMPFVIGVLGVDGPGDNIEQRYRKIHETFRTAMAAPASLPEFKGNVIAVQTAPFWDMPLDRVQKKFEQVAQHRRALQKKVKSGEITNDELTQQLKQFEASLLSPQEVELRARAASNAGYHYYGCAKIMAQIGQAFAKATLKLQPPKAR